MIWIILGLALLVPAVIIVTVISIEKFQYNRNQKVIQSLKNEAHSTKTLVVFFSRSGNTELMARKIASLKNGDIVPLQADHYRLGFWGWLHALHDARGTETEITPTKIALTGYDTIYIGSPIWLYSPAPPVWEFVMNNDFTNKNVILFNSMNSNFGQNFIDNFKSEVEKQGGKFIKHIYINRGRMTQQMDVDAFLKEVESKID